MPFDTKIQILYHSLCLCVTLCMFIWTHWHCACVCVFTRVCVCVFSYCMYDMYHSLIDASLVHMCTNGLYVFVHDEYLCTHKCVLIMISVHLLLILDAWCASVCLFCLHLYVYVVHKCLHDLY